MDFDNPKFKELFFNIFNEMPRGGPGNAASTRRAYALVRNLPAKPRILDVGCGPGKQTLDLAAVSAGEIIAIDTNQHFIDRLEQVVQKLGLSSRIRAHNADMNCLDFPERHFDIIWSEGAVYQMGFENGLRTLGRFLKPGGYFALTEAVWLRPDPPRELRENWDAEYPDIKDVAANLEIISKCGYVLVEHFILPPTAWWDEFYAPMQMRIAQVRRECRADPETMRLIPVFENEIAIYQKYSDYFGYAFFVMRKPG
ncbi:class I SAM-dependent methyltransferase [candidate division FCPU426 bacterium]|nr:class I SAM-dependent methyltransferase [candidate division FCPU426 bacterium]